MLVARFAVLELDGELGGNAQGGLDHETGLRFPWGAHYVPPPTDFGGEENILVPEWAQFLTAVTDQASLMEGKIRLQSPTAT